jgi:hypothetical protein
MHTGAANIDCIILYFLRLHAPFQIFADIPASRVVAGMVTEAACCSTSVPAGQSFHINFMTVLCTFSRNWIYILLISEQHVNNACSVTLQIRLLCVCYVCPERKGTCNVLKQLYAVFLHLPLLKHNFMQFSSTYHVLKHNFMQFSSTYHVLKHNFMKFFSTYHVLKHNVMEFSSTYQS